MLVEKQIVTVGNRKIGDGFPVFIVFEAGPTHNGFDTARKLIDIAAEAGADAIKFQILDARRLVPDRNTLFTYKYLVDRDAGVVEEVTEPLQDILMRREMSREEWEKLISYCRNKGLEFFATATEPDGLEFLINNNVNTVKICSGDINHFYLLEQASTYDWSIQLDTGCATLGEVEQAVDFLEERRFNRIVINHCPSGYPAEPEKVNLRIIQTLKSMFPYPVAFSDHSPSWHMDVAAIALGANMIEKTITLDKTTKSPEHIMSLEPHEASQFVKDIRKVEIALGRGRRVLKEDEKIRCLVARRSIFAARDIKAGEILTEDMIDYRRPGDGIAPSMAPSLLGKMLKRNVKCGEKLSFGDFEWNGNQLRDSG